MGTPRRMLFSTLVILLAFNVAHSGEENDLRATIAKGLKARGGEGSEAKIKGLTMKGTGTFFGLGEGIPFTGEWHSQGKTQSRSTVEIKAGDQTLIFTKVINGDKGWEKLNDEVKAMPADELAEEKEEMQAKWLATLTPLRDQAFKLAPLGEVKIGDKDAVGVHVASEGHREVNLYFDKTSGLLVKTEYQVKDIKGGAGKEMSQETFFADYKETMGTKYPTKVTIKRDGKQFVEVSMTDFQPLETVEANLFAKP